MLWLIFGHLARAMWRRGDGWGWADGLLTSVGLLVPLGVAYAEIRRLTHFLPPPQYANLFVHDPPSWVPGAILLVPLAVWGIRRRLARKRPTSRIWGVERPALEIWYAVLSFGPAVAWLGNPAWWRHALPRLAHYYQLSTARRGTLPEILNIYYGEIYQYSLPWHSAWVLIGITVPPTLLAAAVVGLMWGLGQIRRGDRLPLFFLMLFVTLPLMRMLPTPAHDGVRLMLACFPFLAAFVGWGTSWVGSLISRAIRGVRPAWLYALVTASCLLPAAWELVRVHPYELSYYNALIGGPRGAWSKGFELAYWYDAFTPEVLDDLNKQLPPNSRLSYCNEQSNPVMVLQDLMALGLLRRDLRMWDPAQDTVLPHMLLLTHDSKATSFDRLLFLMQPGYASMPKQLDGLRVVTVADPAAVGRAWALQLLTHGPAARPADDPPAAPEWVRRIAPRLAYLWGRRTDEGGASDGRFAGPAMGGG